MTKSREPFDVKQMVADDVVPAVQFDSAVKDLTSLLYNLQIRFLKRTPDGNDAGQSCLRFRRFQPGRAFFRNRLKTRG